jgi:SCY1-like protein 1
VSIISYLIQFSRLITYNPYLYQNRTLKESASSFPPEFASHRVLPSLISALEFGGASASTILPLVLQFGKNVSPDDYPSIVLAPLIKLYASPDRGTRMALLDHLGEYAEKLDKKSVVDKIWPNLVS